MPSTGPDSPRLGLSLAPSNALSLTDLIESVIRADGLGYESAWIPETWGVELSSVLSVLAMKTSRIFLAGGVFNVYSRSAALLAQTAATLQVVSGGRFILGLGASGPGVVERWHGIPYRSPLARTEDYVNIIRMALAGERVEYSGGDLPLSGFRLGIRTPAPVPIYIAALGPANVSMTGRLADGWLPIFAARGHMEELFGLLRRGAEGAGRDGRSVDVAAYIPVLIGSRAERLLAQQLAHYIGGMGTYYARYMTRLGFGGAVAEIRSLWAEGNRAGAARSVPDTLLEVATLGSDPARARERLHEYRTQGVRLPILTLPHGTTPEEAAATIGALAPAP
jgi:alkanesulfonate monooxygenase SsuD/methylene tetrahydromethanopterin reductase-like flavin-dependent oxidoreductase (luciferase family)